MGDTITQPLNPLSIAQQVVGPAVSLYNNERNISAQNRANDLNMQENQRNRDFNAQEAEKQRSFEAIQAQLANQFNADEALKSFQRSSQFQKEMWQKQNEYDSPKAQVQRLVEAGLNPNLFGGDNTSGSFGAASAPSASANMPHGSAANHGSSLPVAPPSYSNPLMDAANLRLANAQARNLETQAERTEKLLPGEIRSQDMDLRVSQSNIQVNDATIANLGASTRSLEQSVEQSKEYTRLLGLQAGEKQKELDHYEEKFQMIIEKHAQELAESKSRIKVNEASVKEFASRVRLNIANAQNAEDLHILNGVNLRFVKEHEEALVRFRWNEERKKYDAMIDDYSLHSYQNDTKREESKRSRQLSEKRNADTWYNDALDWVGFTVDALGAPFGAGVNYGVHSSSSSAEGSFRTKSSDNVNHNYNTMR